MEALYPLPMMIELEAVGMTLARGPQQEHTKVRGEKRREATAIYQSKLHVLSPAG